MELSNLLNPMQLEAVYQTEGPVLILAGAGSGKTRVLTYRVAYLIEQGVSPWNIMAITFTNKAAGEMKERVDAVVGSGAESVWIATFHSSCARILRRYIDRLGYDTNFAIYDTDDSKSIIKEVAKKLNIDTKRIKERTIMNEISSAKNEMMGPDEYKRSYGSDFVLGKIADCYEEYEKALRKNNALDFDDLLLKCVELFKKDEDVLHGYQDRFKYICVDEYQDTNSVQFELVRLLADAHHNICVVGDDDQSIYKFRGANIRNILDFESVYPKAKVVKLEQNYRSTSNILNAANAVIANNTNRKVKTLWTDKGDGENIHFELLDSAWEESHYIAEDIVRKIRKGATYKDFAILYRTNAQSRILEESLVMEGLPYNVVGGTNFYSRREIKDILSYLKTIDNGRDDLACKRIINIPKRGIGATSIIKIQEYADEHGISFYEAVCNATAISTLGKSASKMAPFVNTIEVLKAKNGELSLTDLFDDMMETIRYEQYLEDLAEEDTDDRLENIDELRNKLVIYEETADEPTLSGFLEEVALVADIDGVDDNDDKILLMTLHSAKGLEFKNVYIAGMEDGVFPSNMTIISDDRSELEEERRLAYVGITRAKENLTLTAARSRMIRGETQHYPVSRFVREIPKELLFGQVPERVRGIEDAPKISSYSRSGSYTSETSGDRPYDRNASATGTYVKPVAPVKPVALKGTRQMAKPYILQATQAASAGKKQNVSSGTVTGNSSGGPLPYAVGDRVMHSKYGEGSVLDIKPGPKDYQVTVLFDTAGQKIMYAGFAKLQKV
ncbi:MAG: UvrD-helicase domain-containing protein [Lachnospiraceae bacterium]|nr:UvrD-helicase domain-containing protein [Lachnospiraceae bacterium]